MRRTFGKLRSMRIPNDRRASQMQATSYFQVTDPLTFELLNRFVTIQAALASLLSLGGSLRPDIAQRGRVCAIRARQQASTLEIALIPLSSSLNRFTEIAHQVIPVSNLQRLRGGLSSCSRVVAAAISAHNLHFRMPAEPACQRASGPVGHYEGLLDGLSTF